MVIQGQFQRRLSFITVHLATFPTSKSFLRSFNLPLFYTVYQLQLLSDDLITPGYSVAANHPVPCSFCLQCVLLVASEMSLVKPKAKIAFIFHKSGMFCFPFLLIWGKPCHCHVFTQREFIKIYQNVITHKPLNLKLQNCKMPASSPPKKLVKQ